MQIITDKQLLSSIRKFLKRTKMPPSRFGLITMGDGALLKTLERGRSLSLKNAEKIISFMEGYSADHSDDLPTKDDMQAAA